MKERDAINDAILNDARGMAAGKPEAMQIQLERKADKADIARIDEQKINKAEITNLLGRLSVMQKEVTHLLVLLGESFKLHLIKPNDTNNSRVNRASELISQV